LDFGIVPTSERPWMTRKIPRIPTPRLVDLPLSMGWRMLQLLDPTGCAVSWNIQRIKEEVFYIILLPRSCCEVVRNKHTCQGPTKGAEQEDEDTIPRSLGK
jgi:hypothetical protein